jgi:hypothetical protein
VTRDEGGAVRSRFDDDDLAKIDDAYRRGATPRCPHDEKPLVHTTWEGPLRMVYFVCRACGRIGAIGYDKTQPGAAGVAAVGSRRSSKPPPRG